MHGSQRHSVTRDHDQGVVRGHNLCQERRTARPGRDKRTSKFVPLEGRQQETVTGELDCFARGEYKSWLRNFVTPRSPMPRDLS